MIEYYYIASISLPDQLTFSVRIPLEKYKSCRYDNLNLRITSTTRRLLTKAGIDKSEAADINRLRIISKSLLFVALLDISLNFWRPALFCIGSVRAGIYQAVAALRPDPGIQQKQIH